MTEDRYNQIRLELYLETSQDIDNFINKDDVYFSKDENKVQIVGQNNLYQETILQPLLEKIMNLNLNQIQKLEKIIEEI